MNKVIMALIAIVCLQLGVYAASTNNASCRLECIKCADTCDSTLSHCHTTGDSHKAANHIKAMQDCVRLCRDSADFISRNSALSDKMCALCAEACNQCAQSCETFKGDKTMQSCAQECRTCAQACQNMAG
jgi:hypothetical protein